jgi:hypothetical protein
MDDQKQLLDRRQFIYLVGSMIAAAVLTYFVTPHETIESLQTGNTNTLYGGR